MKRPGVLPGLIPRCPVVATQWLQSPPMLARTSQQALQALGQPSRYEYEAANPGERGVVLRREGLYSSHLVEWRRLRDAGALAGLAATRGRPPADPVERDNARLRASNAQLEQDLATAREVIAIQGKLSALLDDLSKRAHDASTPPRSGPSSPPRSSS